VFVGYTSLLAGGSATSGWRDGTGTNAYIMGPKGLALDSSGNLYVATSNDYTVRMVNTAGVSSTIAGQYGVFGTADGVGTVARFNTANAVVVDTISNAIYVGMLDSEGTSGIIRKLTSSGSVSTFATVGPSRGMVMASSGLMYVASSYQILAIGTSGSSVVIAGSTTSGLINGFGTNAKFSSVGGLAQPALSASSVLGTGLYGCDYGNHVIRLVTTVGSTSIFAGSSSGTPGFVNGNLTTSRFSNPFGLAISTAGVMFVSDQSGAAIRMISSAGNFIAPDIYCAYSLLVGLGIVSTIAGSSSGGGYSNGFGTNAAFGNIKMIALSTDSKLYLADSVNYVVSVLDLAGALTRS
jgi:hypothetical protein